VKLIGEKRSVPPGSTTPRKKSLRGGMGDRRDTSGTHPEKGKQEMGRNDERKVTALGLQREFQI